MLWVWSESLWFHIKLGFHSLFHAHVLCTFPQSLWSVLGGVGGVSRGDEVCSAFGTGTNSSGQSLAPSQPPLGCTNHNTQLPPAAGISFVRAVLMWGLPLRPAAFQGNEEQECIHPSVKILPAAAWADAILPWLSTLQRDTDNRKND